MKKFHLFFLLLMMAVMVPQTASAEYHGIKVGGVSVTSDNCDNITGENIKRIYGSGDYWVRYEPSTKTLTLHNISIERKGSGNRAILNESCDGLTIVFEGAFNLSSQDASPIRLNANTTITCTKGLYGQYTDQYNSIWSWNSDAITVSNGAQLVLSNIQLDVSSTNDAAFLGGTGSETIILVDALVETSGMLGYGMRNIKKLGIQNSSLIIKSKYGVENLKEFTLAGKERMTVLVPDEHYYGAYGQPTTTPVYYSETEQTFLSSEGDSKANNVAILSYIPIDEQTFPDETFRNYVSEKFDDNSNGELDFYETLKVDKVSVYNKGVSSLQGIEHLHFLKTLDCRFNNLTRLNFASDMNLLSSLDCYQNQLTQLDLTKCPKLEKLNCSYNNLTFLDFSNCNIIHDISIQKNSINEWMTDVLESLPEITEASTQWSNGYNIIVSNSSSYDNICTGEQANIARNKGWNVVVGGLDEEGNVVFEVKVGGSNVTSGNCDDLTVLPGVTKNNDDGYAYYNPTTQTLHLSGVDIVNEDGDEGIRFDIPDATTIELGQDPVGITAKNVGIYCSVPGTLTITTKESYWYSEKLNIVSTEGRAIVIARGNCVINGVARVEAKDLSANHSAVCEVYGDLTIAGDAELRLKAQELTKPLSVDNLILQDDNIIVTPAEATLVSGSLRDAEGKTIYGKEVVIGKLRQYNAYVAGTRITNANQHAVLGDTTIVFQEPAHNTGTGTLVLNNANIEAGSENGIEGTRLRIKLIGENHVSSTKKGIGFGNTYCYIEGPGSLYTTGQYGIDATSKLYISDGAQITAEGSTRYAIDSKETIISGKKTVVKMKCSPDARGTFRASTGLTLEDGLKIEEPAGAQYVDGEIRDAEGNVIKDEWVTIEYTEAYDITVAGIGITNHNMNDVLGDGTVSYDPETNTLTLDNVNIDGGAGSGIEAEQGLHIKLEGSNTITCTTSLNGTSHGIWFKNTSYIEGPGSLNISAMYGIYAETNALKILDGAQITAEAENIGIMSGITTISGTETVVNTKGGEASFACISLTLNDGLEITQPEGASFVLSQHAICAGRRNTVVAGKWVTISKPAEVQTYDLYIAGIQVSTENQEDVLGDGTVSFDPETNTLTLMNANITPAEDDGIRSTISDLQIRLIGQNYITPTQYKACINFFGAGSKGTIVFYGGGSLELKSPSTAFLTMHDLVFTDGVKVSAESMHYWGITGQTNGGYPSITMSGEETVLMAKSGDAYYGSLVFFNSLTLNDGLKIGLPEGATFVENTGVVDAEGTQVAGEWVVIASQDYIDGVQTLSSSPLKGEGIYNLAGQKVGNDYKGIVIIGNKKYLKK